MKMKLHPDLPLVMQTAINCHDILRMAKLRHVIIGGLAVYLHGDRDRQPRDVDLLICSSDANHIRARLLANQYIWNGFRKACVSPFGVRTEWHHDGEKTKKGILQLPDPVDIEIDTIEGLPVAELASLIELKLKCVLQPLRQEAPDPKHRNDVIALIKLHNLDEQYALGLECSVQELFVEIYQSSMEDG